LSLRLVGSIAAEIPASSFTPSPLRLRQSCNAGTWRSTASFIDHYSHSSTGFEMVRKDRAIPAFALVPIVMVTNAHEPACACARSGRPNGLVQIPIDRRDFFVASRCIFSLQAHASGDSRSRDSFTSKKRVIASKRTGSPRSGRHA